MAGSGGSVTIDLQAAQSPHYRDRGIARYAVDFTRAVTRTAPDLFRQVLLNPSLPDIGGLESIQQQVSVTTFPDWSAAGGVFHALSPFELDIPVRQLWPREASRAGMRLVITLYDLIPELFPDMYLSDPGQRRKYRARRELIRAADHVMTLSHSAAADAVNVLGIQEQRVSVVGAAPGDAFSATSDRAGSLAAARHQIPGLGERFVVYNGAVEPRKNMESLVEGFAAVPDHVRSGWQLVLVCRLKPLERNHFEVRARNLGIESQLLLTGYLPDEQLALLYQAAELVVYPSLYEGYGLPVAEALACGAPVIASSESSLPELVAPDATFNPRSVDAIRQAIQHAILDEPFRQRLRDWATSQQPTWDGVASAAVEVYERVLSMPGGPASRWRRRPLVALVSPVPPSRTGVADYTARLLEGFKGLADVDVFADGDDAPSVAARPATLPMRDTAIGGYDSRVLVVGNSEFHGGALKLLRVEHADAFVQAHDAKLTGLYLHGEARGAVPEGVPAVAGDLYPELDLAGMNSTAALEAVEDHGGLMAREVVALARAVFVTSERAAGMVMADCHKDDRGKIVVWDYAYPPVVARIPDMIDGSLICSFGLVNPLKSPDLIIRGFAHSIAATPDARLVFVGPIAAAIEDELTALAESLRVLEAITFTGDIDDHAYRSWLDRAAVAVQLRTASNGETSGAVADCLAHGVPVLVTSIGPQADLPEFVPKVPADVSPMELGNLLSSLFEDDERRGQFADKAHEFVASRGFRQAAQWFVDHIW